MSEKKTVSAEPLQGEDFKAQETTYRADAQKACSEAIAALDALVEQQANNRFGGAVRSTLAFCIGHIEFEREQIALL